VSPREPVKIPQKLVDTLLEPEFQGYPFPVFEVPLEKLCSRNQPVPYIIRAIIKHLLVEEAILTEGLFRIPGSAEDIQMYRRQFDEGKEVDFSKSSFHDVAGLLKEFFRKLPEPLIPFIYDQQVKSFVESYRAKEIDEAKLLESMKSIIDQLPTENLSILKLLIQLLSLVITHSDVNMMTTDNVIKCIVPSVGCIPAIFGYTIANYDYFFVETSKSTLTAESNPEMDRRGGRSRREPGSKYTRYGHKGTTLSAASQPEQPLPALEESDIPAEMESPKHLPVVPENAVVEIPT